MRPAKSNPILVLDDLEASMMLAGHAANQRKNAAARMKRKISKEARDRRTKLKNEAFMLGYRVGRSNQIGPGKPHA